MEFTADLTHNEFETEDEFNVRFLHFAFTNIYIRFLMGGLLQSVRNPVLFSSARNSIPLFLRELDFTRSQVVRLLQQRADERDKEPVSDSDPLQNTSRYALPIHDNIDLIRDIPKQAERYDNKPQNVFPGDIEKMLGGYFKSIDGDLLFVSNTTDGSEIVIPLNLSSSSVREMSSLYCFLGYFIDVEKGNFVIIDEPESHLDTANQIQLARLLARLVNSGIKVFITTHSDYIIREINNLIMLSSPLEDGEQAKRELGYQEGDQLTLEQVRAYVAENGTLTPCENDKFGIEVPVLDETIESLNQRSEKLAIQIMMKERGE